MSESHDYIIVGGGPGGCPVANRLSADKRTTVCLIEAGGDNQHVTVRVPLLLIANVPKKNGFNWAFDTVPQKGLNGRVGYQPRGKGMGGSSAINALVERTFSALMNDAAQPVYLAKLNLKPRLVAQHPELIWDVPTLTVFRSVLMKPEHLAYVPVLHERVLTALH